MMIATNRAGISYLKLGEHHYGLGLELELLRVCRYMMLPATFMTIAVEGMFFKAYSAEYHQMEIESDFVKLNRDALSGVILGLLCANIVSTMNFAILHSS